MSTKGVPRPALTQTAPIVLKYEGRRVTFVGTQEKPEWIAQDLCDILDIKNVSQALAGLDPDEKGICTAYTASGRQTMLTVYESGMYALILKSRKPEAKKFRKWITSEVLPSIRKYGTYPPPEAAPYQITLKPYTSRVVWTWKVRQALPPGYWCVFIEGAELLISAEHILGPANLEMKQYDLLDGSMGKCYATHRAGQRWAGDAVRYEYTFPDNDPRGTVNPWCYPLKELEHFKDWLHTEYATVQFPAYIKRKYGAVEYQKALPIMASMGVLVSGSGNKPAKL